MSAPCFECPKFFSRIAYRMVCLPVLCSLVWLQGCATEPRLTDVREDLDQIRIQVEKLQKDRQEAGIRKRVVLNELQGMLQAEPPLLANSKSIMNQQIRAASPPGSGIKPDTTTAVHTLPRSARPLELFQAGMDHFNNKNYSAALLNFQRAYEVSPNEDDKARSLFWMGECHYRSQEWSEAIRCYDALAAQYPHNATVPNAFLKKAYAYLYAGEQEIGVQVLQTLIKLHPQTDEAALARMQLQRMKTEF